MTATARKHYIPAPLDEIPASAQRHRQIKKHAVLFRQDDPTSGLFLVIEGRVELQRHTQNGEMIVIHRAVEGETFAEASLFSETYHCDAVATLETTLIEFDRQIMLAQFQDNPAFASALTRRFAGQIQHYRRKLEIIAIKRAEDRVLAGMVEGLLQADIKTFAAEIGLTHEVVYRALAKLVKAGKLEKTARGQFQLFGE